MPETLTEFIINALAPDSHKSGTEPEREVSPAEQRVPEAKSGNEPDIAVLSTLTSCNMLILAQEDGILFSLERFPKDEGIVCSLLVPTFKW